MTRLIDADRMNAMLRHDNMIAAIVEEFVDEQPTVDAIPIWWIEAKKSKMIRGGDRELTLRWLLQDWQLETRR